MNAITGSCRPRCVADALGLGSLADTDEGADAVLLLALFAHARGEDGKRELYEGDPTFKRGWVNLDATRARELVSTFVALDEADDLKSARKAAQANLEAQPWNDVLGIEEPPIRLRIKIHGAKWGMRFQSCEPALRGREAVNEDLPPARTAAAPNGEGAPVAAPAHAEPEGAGGAPLPAPSPDAPARENDEAADALRKGGFPA